MKRDGLPDHEAGRGERDLPLAEGPAHLPVDFAELALRRDSEGAVGLMSVPPHTLLSLKILF